MRNKRILACWLLLALWLFAAGTVLSIGSSQARYQNTAEAAAVVKNVENGVSSNCLVTKADAPRTVLLGEMHIGNPACVEFWMLSSGADATEKLNWGISEANKQYEKFLNISMYAGFEMLQAESELELLEDLKMDLTLCIELTDAACFTPHEELRLNVYVTWGDEMWGTFQVILPEVLEMELTEPTEESSTEATTEAATEIASDATTEATTEAASEATTEATTEAASEATTEAATEIASEATNEATTEAASEATTEATTEAASDATTEATTEAASEATTEATTEVASEATTEAATEIASEATTEATTEAASEATTEAATENASEATTEATTEAVSDATTEAAIELEEEEISNPELESQISFKSLKTFHPSELLPVRIDVPEEITAFRLGTQMTYGEYSYFEAFPDYTMFSLDGGASYYMLYGGDVPEFILNGVTEISILLDFTYADIDFSYMDEDEQEKFVLAVEVYLGDTYFKTFTTDVTILQESSSSQILHLQTLDSEETSVQTVDITDDTQSQLVGPILTFDHSLEIVFPVAWEDAQLIYSVEFLTMTEDQKLQYAPVTLTEDTLQAVYICEDNTHKLVFTLGDNFITPGTYRLNMTWTYEDVRFSNTHTTFFVHYSARTDEALSS